jgi:hypothetical protein
MDDGLAVRRLAASMFGRVIADLSVSDTSDAELRLWLAGVLAGDDTSGDVERLYRRRHLALHGRLPARTA